MSYTLSWSEQGENERQKIEGIETLREARIIQEQKRTNWLGPNCSDFRLETDA